MAQGAGIPSLFPAQSTSYVTDMAGVIDPASRAAMTDLIRRLRGATGAVVVVVTLPTIGDYDPADVGLAIGRTWKVGEADEVGSQRRNAGIVILLVPKHGDQRGRIQVATGLGLEGIITDATAGRIADHMLPELQAGNYGAALLVGTRETVSLIARGFNVSDSALTAASPATDDGGAGPE